MDIKEHEEMRTLTLYNQQNKFNSDVETVTILAFLNYNRIPYNEGKDIRELAQKESGKSFIMDEWKCILERTSKISRQGDTLVAGLVNILRFLYATEFISYEIYPQHPLHRARLDTYLTWQTKRVTSDGLFMKSDLATIEDYFFKQDKLFICGFDKCSLADIAAFFAIMPAHKDWLADPA